MRDAVGRLGSVLVLGGNSEIGLEIAEALVRERGVRGVILAGRDPGALDRHAGRLQEAGATAVTGVAFDALDVDGHAAFVDDVWNAHGDIDVVVAAFGVLGDQAAAEKDANAALHTVRTNYVGAVSVLTAVGQRIEQQGHGSVVVLSSVAGDRGRRSNYVYGSTKAGLDVFAQGLGDRLHAAGGHVLIVRPGFVHTKMTEGMSPAPLSTTPDVVAAEVLKGIDKRAAVVYAPPLVRVLMAILKALPRAIFRLLPS